MSPIPLITSLPPALKRPRPDGVDVGRAYQEECARSWSAAGFRPVSINSRQEIEESPELLGLADALGVTIAPVDRDARDITGRPHIYLADVLAKAGELTDGVFAFANADILLTSPAELYSFVESLPVGRCAALARVDFVTIGDPTGRMFAHGFDFFAMHVTDARRAPDIGLIIGAPWWDHYLPILLRLFGTQLVPHNGPPICHMMHADRWNWDVWTQLGWRFAAALHEGLPLAFPADPAAHAYVSWLREALAAALCNGAPGKEEVQTALNRIAALNMNLLNASAAAPRA